MKQHNGIRPHDVVVLLRILLFEKEKWFAKDLAMDLFISPAEISASLSRSSFAGLLDPTKRIVQKIPLYDFICSGLKYVFPVKPGPLSRGIPTAYSTSELNLPIVAEEKIVWADMEGTERGMTIEPLYPGLILAVKKNHSLYKMLALVEIIRIGKVREVEQAKLKLKEMIFENGQ